MYFKTFFRFCFVMLGVNCVVAVSTTTPIKTTTTTSAAVKATTHAPPYTPTPKVETDIRQEHKLICSPNVKISTTTTIKTTTTTSAVKTTTHAPPYTPTPKVVRCNVCAGPEFLCEKLFMEQECYPPNNYCINKLSNHKDGSRIVTRHCGNFDTCYREWFLGSSDSDKCHNFQENKIITLDFNCTYCCTEDGCNMPIRPSDNTLYIAPAPDKDIEDICPV